MIVLTVVASVGVAVSMLYYVAASAAAIRFAFRAASPPPPLPKIPPRIAILKPLHGLSETLVDNITSFLELRYPRVEYYFGVSDYEDRAAEVPLALKPRYHAADINLVVGEEPDCANHKVAKLIKMAERPAKAEIFAVSDADVEVDPDHLRRVAGELTANDRTGLVTCAYRARPRGGLGSRLDALFVNTDFAPMVMLSAMIEPMRHALGATMAVKRGAFEAVGGFRALKDRLADDFFLGRMVAEHGWSVRLSTSLVTVNCEQRRFADFWNHQLRWARTFRTVRPLSLATIMTHGPFWALVLLIASRLNPIAIALFFAVIAARLGMAVLMIVKVLQVPELKCDLWLVPLKDLVMTGIWFASLCGNTVRWSGRRLKVFADGTMREVND
jgi:ceramide glucosyltransferase